MARVAPDSNDVFVMLLNDGPGTHLNAGSAGSAGNWVDYGNPISGVSGIISDAMYIPGSYLTSNLDGAGGANDILITPNVSISGWVHQRRFTNFFGELFNKQYFLNGWSTPFLTFGFQMDNTTDGRFKAYITTVSSGNPHSTAAGTNFPLPYGKWAHIGSTWDGTNLTLYMNDSLVSSAAFTGAIDYNTVGTRGQWYVGAIPGAGTNQTTGAMFNDIRIANVVRPQSYFANIYYQGMFVNG